MADSESAGTTVCYFWPGNELGSPRMSGRMLLGGEMSVSLTCYLCDEISDKCDGNI